MITGIVKGVRFTSGSPFGEQWWTIEVDGKDESFAMWMGLKSPLWANKGQKVAIKRLGDMKCHTGGGGYIVLRNTAAIVEILS